MTVTTYKYTRDGLLKKSVADFTSFVNTDENSTTTTTNKYSNGLLEKTETYIRYPNTGNYSQTITTYGYLTLSNKKTFLATEMTEEYENGEWVNTRVTSKNPTGRGQGAATDNQGNSSASGNRGDDRITPYYSSGSGYSAHADYETETQYRDIEGLALIDTSFPIQNINRKSLDFLPWENVDKTLGFEISDIDDDKGTGRLEELAEEIKWLNRKTQETVSLTIYGFPHLIDFNDRVLLNGAIYFLVSNTASTTPRRFNEQQLTLRRWI